MERGELQCVLIGFGAGVDEEEAVVLITAGLPQPFGQLALQRVDDGV